MGEIEKAGNPAGTVKLKLCHASLVRDHPTADNATNAAAILSPRGFNDQIQRSIAPLLTP
jgi:hypothetical protein